MTVAAALLTAEILHFKGQSYRADAVIRSLSRLAYLAGVRVSDTHAFRGRDQWLVLWGPGAPDRVEPMRRQIAAGGHVLACDLSYWDRDEKFRISIDSAHPQLWVMQRPLAASRLMAANVRIEQTWNPDGPVIVAGIGEKAGIQYGIDAVHAWERQQIVKVVAAGRRVLYRPKKDGAVAPGIMPAPRGPIESILRGASAVVTWHSNVAVDAIRMGIPAVCRDGAAAAVCPETWSPDLRPLSPAEQRQFLANLAWFQWTPAEARACWTFLQECVAC
jgi:hypothetical protein